MQDTQVKCPNCQTVIDVQNILSHQLEDELRKKFQLQLNEERKKAEQKEAIFNKEKEEFEQKKQKLNELFQDKLETKLREERKILEERLNKKITEEKADEFALLQKELNEKSTQVKELNKSKAEIEQLKREKNELKESIEAASQLKLNQTLQEEKEKIRKQEEDKNELRFKEMQKQLEDQKRLTEEMKRKQEQGSMQLQGEVMELAIEEFLSSQFPLDNITEIKKGARGADCIQIINTRTNQNCGTIYYESKRTKEFQSNWIEKFKSDIRDIGANIGVLVTDVMPKDMERMGLKEGIWICSFEEFKGLCAVLRESIIQISNALASQENKGDKMQMLYNYLTGNTFRLQVEAIVEGFTQMRIDLESEKRAMQSIWKKRERQIEKVTINTIDMHASIKGIAGNAIQAVKLLELPEANDDFEG